MFKCYDQFIYLFQWFIVSPISAAVLTTDFDTYLKRFSLVITNHLLIKTITNQFLDLELKKTSSNKHLSKLN